MVGIFLTASPISRCGACGAALGSKSPAFLAPWVELVIGAVCAHYGLDREVMAVPRQAKPDRPQPKDRMAGKAKSKKKGEADERGKRQQNGQEGTIRA